MNDILLISVLIIVILELVIIFLLARLVGNLINTIRNSKEIHSNSIPIGSTAPSFKAIDQNGKLINTQNLFSSKRTIIFFVNSTCSTCKNILKYLKTIKCNSNFNLLIINTDEKNNDLQIIELINEDYIYIRNEHIGTQYNIYTVPQIVIISEKSKIKFQQGLKENGELIEIINDFNISSK
ncbi:TlpA family protein disulfide reductase [Bacillus thuringiensis]|uniref:TlpA family protein disulfide reductase n=1 Tax=Bacillus thuringiensis TaxID=1428 RepID=UPI000A3BC13C|nr:thioredoxin family protein [Bacillus thuringiensis]OUA87632.1 hypothetical protein BK706_18460 [Bacillus thuringiensis serovar leesis]